MTDFKIDISKFNVTPGEARKQFQGLAHMAEIAERHEGKSIHFLNTSTLTALLSDSSTCYRSLCYLFPPTVLPSHTLSLPL